MKALRKMYICNTQIGLKINADKEIKLNLMEVANFKKGSYNKKFFRGMKK